MGTHGEVHWAYITAKKKKVTRHKTDADTSSPFLPAQRLRPPVPESVSHAQTTQLRPRVCEARLGSTQRGGPTVGVKCSCEETRSSWYPIQNRGDCSRDGQDGQYSSNVEHGQQT